MSAVCNEAYFGGQVMQLLLSHNVLFCPKILFHISIVLKLLFHQNVYLNWKAMYRAVISATEVTQY